MSTAKNPIDQEKRLNENNVVKQKVGSGYDHASDIYDESFGSVYIRQSKWLLRDLFLPETPTILDIGCGTGIATFELRNKCNGQGAFYGIDISQQMIEHSKRKAEQHRYINCHFQQGDAEHLDFPNDMFNAVISNIAFHWIPNKQQALSEIYRVLKPGGQIALQFCGDLDLKESIALKMLVEERHPEISLNPGWREFTREGGFPTLKQMHELFETTNFQNVRIYALHELGYVDPKIIPKLPAIDPFWYQLSFDVVTALQREYIKEVKKRATDKGFERTRYTILTYGKKPSLTSEEY